MTKLMSATSNLETFTICMHISITPIVRQFEELANKFLDNGGSTAWMNTPMDQLPLLRKPPTRAGKIELSKPMKATHSFLFKKGKICEVTGSMLTTPESHINRGPC